MNKRVIGFVLIALGILLVASAPLLTGYTIYSNNSSNFLPIMGLAFFIVGLVLLMEEDLEGKAGKPRVIRTRQFEREIKRHPIEPINNAIARIGQGSKDEERLKHGRLAGSFSIKAGKGERIIYRKQNGEIFLEHYLSSHEYDRYQ